jgi:hypothetical protein
MRTAFPPHSSNSSYTDTDLYTQCVCVYVYNYMYSAKVTELWQDPEYRAKLGSKTVSEETRYEIKTNNIFTVLNSTYLYTHVCSLLMLQMSWVLLVAEVYT